MIHLTARFARDAARLLAAAVCAVTPEAARKRLDFDAIDRAESVRPGHGWVGTENADGKRWYTYVRRDEHGAEISGMSRADPPPGVDPATIPIIPDGPGFPLEKRVFQTRRLLYQCARGHSLEIGPMGPGAFVEDLDDTTRLASLKIVDSVEEIVRDGFARGLRQGFMQPLRDAGAEAMSRHTIGIKPEQVTPVLDALRPVLDAHRSAMIVDGGVSGLFALLDAVLEKATVGTVPWSIISFGVAVHPMNADEESPWNDVAIILMYMRKCGLPGLSMTMGNHFLESARKGWRSALDAPDLDGHVAGLFHVCHSGEIARRIFEDLVPAMGAAASPVVRKSANVAEEWVVRASHAISVAFRNLEGLSWASHRHSVLRAISVGGAERREKRLFEILELHGFYPKAFRDALIAPAPISSSDETELGRAYAEEYFRLVGYAAPIEPP